MFAMTDVHTDKKPTTRALLPVTNGIKLDLKNFRQAMLDNEKKGNVKALRHTS